jgi:hypothetical protein
MTAAVVSMTSTTIESVTSAGESVASAGESVASAAMTTAVTSTVTVTSTRKGQRCHREHAHHCQNCQFRFYNFTPCYVLSFAHPRFEYQLWIGRIAASQQSRMELGLRLSGGFQRANDLRC